MPLPDGRRRVYLLGVGLAQAALTAFAGACCAARTDAADTLDVSLGGEIHNSLSTVLGYPVPWAETRRVRHRPWREPGPDRIGPPEDAGRNPVVPVALVAATLTLPPVAAAAVGRAVRRREPRPRPTRAGRLAGAVLVGSVAALIAAWAEAETASGARPTPWAARPPGAWVAGAGRYERGVEAAAGARRRARDRAPWLDVWLAPDWPARTRLTLGCLLLGVAAGYGRPRTGGASGPG